MRKRAYREGDGVRKLGCEKVFSIEFGGNSLIALVGIKLPPSFILYIPRFVVLNWTARFDSFNMRLCFNCRPIVFQVRREIAKVRRTTARRILVPAMGYTAGASTGHGIGTQKGFVFLLLSLFSALQMCPGKFLSNCLAA